MTSLKEITSIKLINYIQHSSNHKIKEALIKDLGLSKELASDALTYHKESKYVEFIIGYDTKWLHDFKPKKFPKDIKVIRFFEYHKINDPPKPSDWWPLGTKRVWLHAKAKDCFKLINNGYSYSAPLSGSMIPAFHLAVKGRPYYKPMPEYDLSSEDDDMDQDTNFCNHDFEKAFKEMMIDYNNSTPFESLSNIVELRKEIIPMHPQTL